MPGISPELTMLLIASLFLLPLFFSNSERLSLHHMHQQPLLAPRFPNNASKLSQCFLVSDSNLSSPIFLCDIESDYNRNGSNIKILWNKLVFVKHRFSMKHQ